MMTPEDIIARLLYRDALMLVIDKPCGLPVHKGTGGGETLEDAFEHLRYGLPNPPSLAHRLDRETSGCLILGRHRKALQKLGKLFEQGRVEKTYMAVVHGTPEATSGNINAPLKKAESRSDRWRMRVSEDGMESHTQYRVLSSNNGFSVLELIPKTGRTHQLRVHCAHIGIPIVGDYMYGSDTERNQRPLLHLHAYSVRVPLYPSREAIYVEAPLPEHMQRTLEAQALTV
jgi:tRNA pseudouridine32 synthase / 23S rRNA pseudouridine746 synthase